MKTYAIGCDVGNNSVKLKTSKEVYRIDTLIRQATEARMIFGRGDVGEAVDFLDVDIESTGISGNFYVGSLASGAGGQESIGGLKSENRILKVAALTSLAYVLALESPEEEEFQVALGTGLPVREFFMKNSQGKYDFANVKKYLEQFQGEHIVTFNTKLLNHRKIKLHLDPEEITVLPECYAGLLTVVADEQGNILPRYAKKHISVIGADLGGGSSDFAGYCNENYIEECMFGFDVGINEAQDRFCEDIMIRARLRNFNRHELNSYLFDPDRKGILETNRGTIDLNKEKLVYYKPLVDKVIYNFMKAMGNNSFDISRVNYMYLFGGASEELGSMVSQELKKEIPNIEVVDRPITRNVEAYFSTAREYEEE